MSIIFWQLWHEANMQLFFDKIGNGTPMPPASSSIAEGHCPGLSRTRPAWFTRPENRILSGSEPRHRPKSKKRSGGDQVTQSSLSKTLPSLFENSPTFYQLHNSTSLFQLPEWPRHVFDASKGRRVPGKTSGISQRCQNLQSWIQRS